MRNLIAVAVAVLFVGAAGLAVWAQRATQARASRTYRSVSYKWLAKHCESAGAYVVVRDVRLISCNEVTPNDWAWRAGIYEPSTRYGDDRYFAIVADSTVGRILQARLQGRESLRVTLYLELADTAVGACLHDGLIDRVDLLDEHGKREESFFPQFGVQAPAPN